MLAAPTNDVIEASPGLQSRAQRRSTQILTTDIEHQLRVEYTVKGTIHATKRNVDRVPGGRFTA